MRSSSRKKNLPPPPVITDDIKQAVRYVLLAQVWHDSIAPIVRNYQTKILSEMKAIHQRSGKVIVHPNEIYDMCDDDFNEYLRLSKICRDMLHLKVPEDDICPLLEAEMILLRMKQRFVEYMLPAMAHIMKNITADRIQHDPEILDEFVEINMKWLVPKIPELKNISITNQQECDSLIQELRDVREHYDNN